MSGACYCSRKRSSTPFLRILNGVRGVSGMTACHGCIWVITEEPNAVFFTDSYINRFVLYVQALGAVRVPAYVNVHQ
jgi:hypothetical protein